MVGLRRRRATNNINDWALLLTQNMMKKVSAEAYLFGMISCGLKKSIECSGELLPNDINFQEPQDPMVQWSEVFTTKAIELG